MMIMKNRDKKMGSQAPSWNWNLVSEAEKFYWGGEEKEPDGLEQMACASITAITAKPATNSKVSRTESLEPTGEKNLYTPMHFPGVWHYLNPIVTAVQRTKSIIQIIEGSTQETGFGFIIEKVLMMVPTTEARIAIISTGQCTHF